MKKFFYFFLSAILLLLTPVVVFAAYDSQATRLVRVSSDEVIDKDFYLNAGEIVEISGTVNGDVVVAGGQILIDGTVNGDVLAAGGMINLAGEVTQDVRVAGGQVTISGNVGRNLTVVGGNIDITESAQIGGGALIAGGNVNLSSPIGGDVHVGAGNLTVADSIDGDVNAGVGTLRLTSEAKIYGDFSYFSDEDPLIDESASVSGQIVRKDVPKSMRKDIDTKMIKRAAAGPFRFFSLISALIIGLLMLRFFPNYTKETSQVMSENTLKSLGFGLLVLILAPLAIFILLLTIVGIPLGLVFGFAYLLKIYLAKIFVSVAAGEWLYLKLEKKQTVYGPFVVGIIIYYVLTWIPVLGGLINFLVILLGLGASLLYTQDLYKKASKAKIF